MHVVQQAAGFCEQGESSWILQCRYAKAYPKEDGYRRPETLNEDKLGSDLWSAARVGQHNS